MINGRSNFSKEITFDHTHQIFHLID